MRKLKLMSIILLVLLIGMSSTLAASSSNDSTISITLKCNGEMVTSSNKVVAKVGSLIEVEVISSKEIKNIQYRWDSDSYVQKEKSKQYLAIPSRFEVGSTHMLFVMAEDTSGQKSKTEMFIFEVTAKEGATYQTVNGESSGKIKDSNLDVCLWEENNTRAERLCVNLRNDSESTKGNKNVYALGERATYLIDLKNGDKTINNKASLTLKFPLACTVVESDGGLVNDAARTITWNYSNGIEFGFADTKKVVVKYSSLSRVNLASEKVYPSAFLYNGTILVDVSTVINLVYESSNKVITEKHAPFMHGDAGSLSFRPDDTINRAEGALVLARIILGQDVIDSTTIKPIFPDLNETYPEAQKAIIAISSLGIIKGYSDGTYKPNRSMTKAEFMKIIARFIELEANRSQVKGLQVKGIENLVKLYNNPVNSYTAYGIPVLDHWAIGEVTFLNRLNMTPVTRTNLNLDLDSKISRAEVAQLINYYLLRAPAKVSSATASGFKDVPSSHHLLGDIIEATRAEHSYTITAEGREIAQ